MRNVLLSLIVLISTSAGVLAQPAGLQDKAQAPLVVFVVVDQLRADLLDRYDAHFTAGFRRLRDEGFRFTNGSHFHADTETGAGHATLSTGVVPNRHGIVGNNWLKRVEQRWRVRYAVDDAKSPIIGFPDMPGRSPANLLRSALPDWIEAADPAAKIVSVSRKDRAAITMAGQARGHVYWLAPSQSRFVTSTYYRAEYPWWLDRFNVEVLPEIFEDSVWVNSVPSGLEGLARHDSAAYEGVYSTFPHVHALEGSNAPGDHGHWISNTPFADEATLMLAQTTARALSLGQDSITDYLAVALSATDRIGHAYGPLSLEQFDNLLRLDRSFGAFLDFLDEYVGEDRWLLGFSADHGVQTMPEYRQELGKQAQRLTRVEALTLRGTILEAAAKEGSPKKVASRVKKAILKFPFVEEVLTVADLTAGEPSDSFAILFRNSIHPDRPLLSTFEASLRTPLFAANGVKVRFTENVLATGYPDGTNHGSPYWYDRHVPMIFLGATVSSGSSDEPMHTVDMAPTLAHLAGILYPPDLDGRPILP